MRRVLLMLVVFGVTVGAAAQQPAMREADRIRLAEAFRLADAVQNEVWAGWDQAPFAVLLVAPEHEFLIRHAHPPEDFAHAAYDALLRGDVYVRPRVFQADLLATFPLGGVPTVVVGLPEQTGASSSAWVVTLMHEHFHQMQYARPGYYEAVAALDLSGGDETGMWMLNFPFPYEAPAVAQQAAALSRAALAALRSTDAAAFADKLDAYVQARRHLQALLSADAYRYLSFQLWQEGVARYTEYRVAQAAAARYEPTEAFRALDDFTPFEAVAPARYDAMVEELTGLSLPEMRRVAFYPLGAAEALLLDRARPDWRRRYFAEPFYLDRYFQEP